MRHVQNRFPYPLKCLPRGQDRIIRQRGKSQAQPLGYVNCFTNVIFRPVKRLKLIENLFSEKSAKLYSGFSRGNSTVVITIYFCIVCFEAVVRELGDISNNRLKCAGFQEYDFLLKFTYPGERSKILSLYILSSLGGLR